MLGRRLADTIGTPSVTTLPQGTWAGAVALGQSGAGEGAISAWVQIAMANSSNATLAGHGRPRYGCWRTARFDATVPARAPPARPSTSRLGR